MSQAGQNAAGGRIRPVSCRLLTPAVHHESIIFVIVDLKYLSEFTLSVSLTISQENLVFNEGNK